MTVPATFVEAVVVEAEKNATMAQANKPAPLRIPRWLHAVTRGFRRRQSREGACKKQPKTLRQTHSPSEFLRYVSSHVEEGSAERVDFAAMDSLGQYAILFGTGLAAGFVDTVAGGGGLITLPMLLSLGLPPKDALGTNKFQSSFGSGSATFHYARAGVVNLQECWSGILFTLVGTSLGALAVLRVDPAFLKQLIPILLVGIIIYLIVRPGIGSKEIQPRIKAGMFYPIFGLGLGFYDGFFGPGTGSFWAVVFMFFLGFNMTKATGYTKAMNFTSNLFSLIVFIIGRRVHYDYGVVMAAGQLIGARFGAREVIQRGARFIRPVFLIVVVALTLKLLYDGFWPSH